MAAAGGDYEIYAVGTDGAVAVDLSDSSDGLDLNPDWNPTISGPAPRQVQAADGGGQFALCPPRRNGKRIVDGAAGHQLVGGPNRDVICGRGGNDRIVGKASGDHLDGGQGVDEIQGGLGKDRLLGKDGFNDALNGGAGNDRATADEGRDIIAAEAID